MGKAYDRSSTTQFIKRLIGVHKSTTNIMVHGETGRYPLTMFIKLRTVKFVKHIASQNKHKLSQMAYQYESSVLNSSTQIGQRPNVSYFLSDIEKQISYDEMLNNLEVLKCTHKRINPLPPPSPQGSKARYVSYSSLLNVKDCKTPPIWL